MSKELIFTIIIPTFLYGFYCFNIFDNITCFTKRMTNSSRPNVWFGQTMGVIVIIFLFIGFGISEITKKYTIITVILITILYILVWGILKSLGLTSKRLKAINKSDNISIDDKAILLQKNFKKASEILKESEKER